MRKLRVGYRCEHGTKPAAHHRRGDLRCVWGGKRVPAPLASVSLGPGDDRAASKCPKHTHTPRRLIGYSRLTTRYSGSRSASRTVIRPGSACSRPKLTPRHGLKSIAVGCNLKHSRAGSFAGRVARAVSRVGRAQVTAPVDPAKPSGAPL